MKIQAMRRFMKKTRLQADSVPEITKPFQRVVLGLSDSIEFDGGVLKPGHVLNALVHNFNRMSEEARMEVTVLAVAQLEKLLAEPDDPAGTVEGPRAELTIPGKEASHPPRRKAR